LGLLGGVARTIVHPQDTARMGGGKEEGLEKIYQS